MTEGETALTVDRAEPSAPVMTFSIGPLASAVCVTYVDVQVSRRAGRERPAGARRRRRAGQQLAADPDAGEVDVADVRDRRRVRDRVPDGVERRRTRASRATLIAGAGRKLTVIVFELTDELKPAALASCGVLDRLTLLRTGHGVLDGARLACCATVRGSGWSSRESSSAFGSMMSMSVSVVVAGVARRELVRDGAPDVLAGTCSPDVTRLVRPSPGPAAVRDRDVVGDVVDRVPPLAGVAVADAGCRHLAGGHVVGA